MLYLFHFHFDITNYSCISINWLSVYLEYSGNAVETQIQNAVLNSFSQICARLFDAYCNTLYRTIVSPFIYRITHPPGLVPTHTNTQKYELSLRTSITDYTNDSPIGCETVSKERVDTIGQI